MTTRVRRPVSPFGHKCRARTPRTARVRAKPSFGTRSLAGGDMDEKGLFGRASSVAEGARAFYRARKTEVSPPFGRVFMGFRRPFTAFTVTLPGPAAPRSQAPR